MTKLEILKNDIKKLGNLAVAFSGGVDSSLLLKVAADVLGENALALTVKSPYMSLREIDEAAKFAKFYGIRHEIFEVGIADEIKLSRDRKASVLPYVQSYVRQLEEKAYKNPSQWFNFFDFWR